ncbi:hypothetical protein T492DRAFT_856549 [Pavlovales sp. CCMP2436]|nr:hypothetical protein T492DRAFT_856549 [Pavlovales sp. CCMP2436]
MAQLLSLPTRLPLEMGACRRETFAECASFAALLGLLAVLLGLLALACRVPFSVDLPIDSHTTFWGLRGGACREAQALARMAPTPLRAPAACAADSSEPVRIYQWYGFAGRGRRRADAINQCPGRPWTCVRSFRPETFHTSDAVWVWEGARPEAHCLPPQRAAQVWVLEHTESPVSYPRLYDDKFVGRFSLKVSYEASADVVMTVAHPETEGGLIPPAEWSHLPWRERRAAVAWLSSNCASSNRREELVVLLRARLPPALALEAFGQCACASHTAAELPPGLEQQLAAVPAARLPRPAAGRALRRATPHGRALKSAQDWRFKLELLSRFRFCLVAENSIAPWYVTEKLLHAFAAGCVPLYYGTKDVRAFLPTPSAAVLVLEHRSVESLVGALATIARAAEGSAVLESALGWRRNSSHVSAWWVRLRAMTAAEGMPSRTEQMCALCESVRRTRCDDSQRNGTAAPRRHLRAPRRPVDEVWPPLRGAGWGRFGWR